MSRAIETLNEKSIMRIWPYNLAHAIYYHGGKNDIRDLSFATSIDPNLLVNIVDSDLTERESNVIHLYFEKGMTLKEVAEVFSITSGRILQIKKQSDQKVKASKSNNAILFVLV